MMDTSFRERLTPRDSRICFDDEDILSSSPRSLEEAPTTGVSRLQPMCEAAYDDLTIRQMINRSSRELASVATGVAFIFGLTVLLPDTIRSR